MIIIYFLSFFFGLLIINNLFIIEGFDKNSPPVNERFPWPPGDGPPLSPPKIKPLEKKKVIPKESITKDQPSYCGCIDMNTQILYNQNTTLLSEIKKKLDKLTSSFTNKISPKVKKNNKAVDDTEKTDHKMCCAMGADKEDGSAGLCKLINKFDCAPLPEDEDDEGGSKGDEMMRDAERLKKMNK